MKNIYFFSFSKYIQTVFKPIHTRLGKLRYNTKQLVCFLAFLSLNTFTFAQINTWEGDVSDDWNTAGNWSLGTVPVASNPVIIEDGNPNF